MPHGMDWALRPVLNRLCRYESLVDGTLTLEDILIMNVFLDNQIYNEELRSRANGYGA